MATKKQSLKLFLYKLWNNSHQRKTSGFTLIELMVALVMSSLVIAALLGMLVQLVQTDQGESARNQTQQEMQLALNYIVDDLRDAVYVYGSGCHPDNASSCPQFANFIPNFGANVEPVLAFWKAKPLDDDDIDELPADCNTFTDEKEQVECSNLKIKRRAYSLVVYLQSTESDSTWKGKSRLERYELSKYSDLATLTRSKGFVDPSENQNNFATWPYDGGGNNLQTPGAGGRPLKNQDGYWKATLVDFVDDPSNTTIPAPPECPNPDRANPIYKRIPDADATKHINYTSNSFFACVRDVGGNNVGQNQDVILYLRGNPKDRFSFLNTSSDLQMLQTQVTIGGVIDKTPQ